MPNDQAMPAQAKGRVDFHSFATLFSYAYLLRIPILIGLFLILLPPLALLSRAKPLLENLFVLTTGNIFWAMTVELTLAWSLLVSARVVLLNGKERFEIDQWLKQDTLRWQDLVMAAILPTISLLVCANYERGRELSGIPWWKWFGGALGGALLAYVAGFLALVVAVTLAPDYKRLPAERRFDIPFFGLSKFILKKAGPIRVNPLGKPDDWAAWARKHLPPDLRCGYLDPDGHLYPGHWLALMLLVISGVLYVIVGAFRGGRLGLPSSVPALTYVLILVLVLNWLLSMFAFFLDRYRVPLLIPIALFCALGGQSSRSDHYFALRNGISVPQVSPANTLKAHALKHQSPQHPGGSAIVVATAGGGIQAAGWTAQVLTGLQKECSNGSQSNFADSIAAISAVSGGAVGTLFFVNQYDPRGKPPGFQPTLAELQRIVYQAEEPALAEIGWAMAYIEPFRIVFPYLTNSPEEMTRDRGFALEQTWRNRGSIHAYLSDWREGVEQGWRPAIIFNATIAETGQPILLATTDLEVGTTRPARQTVATAFQESDIPVVTATRLAASFPFVSPASRPINDNLEYHVVDGGYYDNFGVDSLVAWLDQALTELREGTRPNVLVIEIRSFPTDSIPNPTKKGWFYQSYAPANALLSVRTTGQLVRDRDELRLLQEKWLAADHVRIELATFEPRGYNAPLSWELTKTQQDEIGAEWKRLLGDDSRKKNVETVRAFCSAAQ